MYTPISSREFPGWYEIPGFSKYCANEKGQVLTKKTKNVSSGSMSGRYLRVAAYRDGAVKHSLEYLHIMICLAFKGPPPFNGAVVLHKDNNRKNVLPKNLEWGTQSENIQQVWDDGLRVSYQEYPGILDFIPKKLKTKFKSLYSLESIEENEEKINVYLNTAYPTLKNKITIEQHERLLHISINPNIKKFVPNVSRRTAGKEDRSVPRVSVAPTLKGCLIGYVSDLNDFSSDWSDWKGGWYIYGFENETVLRPNKSILFDAEETGECWLVPYSKEKWNYPSNLIGKFFYRQVTTTALSDKKNTRLYHIQMILEISDGSIKFDEDNVLDKGFYRIEFERSFNFEQYDLLEIDKLSSSEWTKLKGLHADKLSFQEPPSLNW
jgi:hypothetical protein